MERGKAEPLFSYELSVLVQSPKNKYFAKDKEKSHISLACVETRVCRRGCHVHFPTDGTSIFSVLSIGPASFPSLPPVSSPLKSLENFSRPIEKIFYITEKAVLRLDSHMKAAKKRRDQLPVGSGEFVQDDLPSKSSTPLF